MSTKFNHLIVVALIICSINSISCSGIFELSLTSLVDSLGRDLRDDCCAWQNSSNQITNNNNNINNHQYQYHHNHNHNQHQHHQPQQQQQQQQSCDPSKCQLIIRICVKNYQTQIEPSQCTFGELSAQVLRQFDQLHLNQNLYLQQQHQLLFQQRPLSSPVASFKARRSNSATPSNIHHQRMLYQQQFQFQQQSQVSKQQLNRGPLLTSSGQSRALRTIAFHQPISFPFNFTWPGSFSLIIDAWFESPTGLQQVGLPVVVPVAASSLAQPTTTYDLYKKQLIIKHSMHGWLAVKNEWTNDVHKTDAATLAYSYRVTCQTNYYGEQCNILCRPRDDVYGHYTCSQQGNIVCLPGWQGSYCLEPICSPGCHKDQGNCMRPNECNCRLGWQGPACEQCVRYEGCVHGSCNKPYECICDEGWGGLLCNEDLNYCANHQPCKNDGICTNTFDSNGIGSYNCTCAPGYAGQSCERRVSATGAAYQPIELQQPETYLIRASADAEVASSNVTTANLQQQQPQQKDQVPVTIKPTAASTTATNNNQLAIKLATAAKYSKQQHHNHHEQQQQTNVLSSFHYPIIQTASTAASAAAAIQPAQLDNRVVAAYGVIIVCMIVLVVLLLLRIFFERASQRNHFNQDTSSQDELDVATLQNQENLSKSQPPSYSAGNYSTGNYSTSNYSPASYSTSKYSTGNYSTTNNNYSAGKPPPPPPPPPPTAMAAAAAANSSTYQSPYYVIYPIHFMPSQPNM